MPSAHGDVRSGRLLDMRAFGQRQRSADAFGHLL